MQKIDEGLAILGVRYGECHLLLSERGALVELNERSKQAVREYSQVLSAETVFEPAPF